MKRQWIWMMALAPAVLALVVCDQTRDGSNPAGSTSAQGGTASVGGSGPGGGEGGAGATPTSSVGGAGGAGGDARAALVIDELNAHNMDLSPEDREAKYCKMAESPHAFFRGTNHLYWLDLGQDARLATYGDAGTRIWIQGDSHTLNYGSFDNDEGTIVYDLNDFDEAVIADYQLDVWRMAVSLVLVAEENAVFNTGEVNTILNAYTETYLDSVASFVGNDSELTLSVVEATAYGRLDNFLADAAGDNSRVEMLDAWTTLPSGDRLFDLSLAKLTDAEVTIKSDIAAQMPSYVARTAGGLSGISGYFTVKDIAKRLFAGTGSLGTPRYYVLIEGASASQDDDRILDVKRQPQPTALPFLSTEEVALLTTAADNNAERTVVAQRSMLWKADDHLGWMTLANGDYSVRERSPFKDDFPLDELDRIGRFENLAEQWGAIIATAHSRADNDEDATLITYSFETNVDAQTDGNHAAFRSRVRQVANEYATQVNADYQTFLDVLASSLSCN